jgi:hypothetical protein
MAAFSSCFVLLGLLRPRRYAQLFAEAAAWQGFAPESNGQGKTPPGFLANSLGLPAAGRYQEGQPEARGDAKAMDEEIFNMELRKFLKKVGVTSQREIETAVRDALDSGKLKGSETLKVKAVLTIEALGLSHDIDGDIKLG